MYSPMKWSNQKYIKNQSIIAIKSNNIRYDISNMVEYLAEENACLRRHVSAVCQIAHIALAYSRPSQMFPLQTKSKKQVEFLQYISSIILKLTIGCVLTLTRPCEKSISTISLIIGSSPLWCTATPRRSISCIRNTCMKDTRMSVSKPW